MTYAEGIRTVPGMALKWRPGTRRTANRTVRFELNLTPKERAALEACARRADTNASAWIRGQIRLATNALVAPKVKRGRGA